ncbi:neuropeptide FF receptor 1-like isoform X2 [Porites lutea]|uniref:neuropeptide FF receptor 1-like isoform X2 n=1 Tax=Porites lutea TaxID=51062 RepID=UPI003CC53880
MDPTNASIINRTTTASVAGMDYIKEPLASKYLRLIVYSVIFLLTITGNALVLAVVYKIRELHTVTGSLIANLAVADLSVGILCIPFTVLYYEFTYWPFGFALCKIIPATQAICIMASIGTLTAISIERYKAIAYPWEPRFSIYQVRFVIAIVWLIAILVGLPFFAVMQLKDSEGDVLCVENWPIEFFKDVYTLLSFCLTYAIPLPLIAVLYTTVVAKLNKAARETSDSEGFRTAKAKGKVIRMLIMVVVFYFLCFLPYHCTFLWIEFGGGDSYKGIWLLLSYCHVLVYSNSAVNPVLYGFLSKQFRRGFVRLVPCCRLWRKKAKPSRNSSTVKRCLTSPTAAWG